MALPISGLQFQEKKEKIKYIKDRYGGGRFVYKKWILDEHGNRIAEKCYRQDYPDLQSTYFYNQDGSEVLRLLRIDVDADKTLPLWKDENGAVDWFKVAQELRERFPNIIRQIEFVTRSQSKKGIHILIGLAPLPLTDNTIKTQIFARKIQSNIITIFNELGIGADTSGKGLKQDFATYRRDENVIHANPILTKRIEKSAKNYGSLNREKFLNQLNSACEEALKLLGLKDEYRLYPDMRLEPKIAKLFLFTMGMYRPVLNSTEFYRNNATENDFDTTYSCVNSVTLTLDQIAEIMNSKKKNIYGKFWEMEEIKTLFEVQKNIDGTITITPKDPDSTRLSKRVQRALAIWNYQPSEFKLNLIPPWLVSDGNRNSAIVSWTLALKWNGVASDVTFFWLLELVKSIPGYEKSSSCKKSQIKATVQSIYRNRREMQGFLFDEPLPEWLGLSKLKMHDNKTKQGLKTGYPINSSRSIRGCLGGAGSSFFDRDLVLPESYTVMVNFSDSVPKLFLVDPVSESYSDNNLKNSSLPAQNSQAINSPLFKILVVTYKQRIGFFYNGELILCMVKNRHYKLLNALKYLEEKVFNSKFKLHIFKNFVHVKHNAKIYKELSVKLYDESVLTFKAQTICGDKKKFSEKMDEYEIKKAEGEGISLNEYQKRFERKFSVSNIGVDLNMEIPF